MHDGDDDDDDHDEDNLKKCNSLLTQSHYAPTMGGRVVFFNAVFHLVLRKETVVGAADGILGLHRQGQWRLGAALHFHAPLLPRRELLC